METAVAAYGPDMPAERVQVKLLLTPEAKAGWEAFKQEHDVNFIALMEVIGRALADGKEEIALGDYVAAARKLATERVRR